MTESLKQVDTGQRRKVTSLTDLVEAPQTVSFRERFPTSSLIKVAVIAALFAAVNWRQFMVLVQKWLVDANWSHGFVIPLFSLYLVYARRDELLKAPRRAVVWGLPLAILSIVAIILSYSVLTNYWSCQISMVALLFSLVLYLGGWRIIRITWLPIAFLLFALPIPDLLYTRIALPLQEFAARCATLILQVLGATIELRASSMTITGRSGTVYPPLTVAEACSGVRSLMAYLALGVAWAYLEDRPVWQRIVLVASTVPVAILCNVGRVTITCSMYVFDRPELGQDFMHEFTGMLMLVPALLMFWGLGKLLQSLFVEVEDSEDAEAPSGHEATSAEGGKA